LAVAEELGVDVEIVPYLKQPPDRATLVELLGMLEDPPADLVRKDALFEKLGLDPAGYVTADAVVELLVLQPKLMQRPVIVRDGRAIIGRPKDRVRALLS
jgi:arsenate reductase